MAELVEFETLFACPLRNGVSYPGKTRGTGVPMVNMREIFAYDRIGDQECERAPLTEGERGTHLLETGDLLFARQSLTYEGAGKCVLVLPADFERTWESHLIRVRLDKRSADPSFYYYYFRSPQGRRSIATIIQQVAAAGIRGSDLRRLTVPCPPLPRQRAIAEVLEALDNKIAANVALAETAISLAISTFHDAVRGAEWSTLTYADVATVGGGGTPRTKVDEYWDGDVRWATPTDITGLIGPYLEDTSRHITAEGLGACASPLYPKGSILMTSRATIGAFAVAEHPTAVNQGFIVVNAHDPALQWWFFHDMRDRVDEFLSHANGATFMELSRGAFKRLAARLSDDQPMKKFGRDVAPLHSRARAALNENRSLAATRDTLLPPLMSGRLRVKDAERVVEGVV